MSRPRHGMTAASLLALVLAMVGLTFASVPLYRLFCAATGYGGTPRVASFVPGITGKPMEVQFTTDTQADLPWRFEPVERRVNVKVGEPKLVYFEAENLSGQVTHGTATFNITPFEAAKYFVKTQCFCFNEQTLQPHESVRMPVTFYVDPAFAKDREVSDVTRLTLSYTFFAQKQ